MKVRVVRPSDLGDAEVQAWRDWQASDEELASPYLCPEFTWSVASVRNDVWLAVVEGVAANPVFFPFQRGKFGRGRPVGGRLSDCHTFIGPAEVDVNSEELLRACGLSIFEYHYWLPRGDAIGQCAEGSAISHCIDLSGGFEAYEEALRRNGSKLMREVRSKARKIEREVGPMHVEMQVQDGRLLDTLFEWKSRQYRKHGKVDLFALSWTKSLLRHVVEYNTEHFGGMLSALYAGDHLLALHMGMRSDRVWNWWFPRHDERFSKMSPGIMLRVETARRAAEYGIRRIDLGMGGEDSYKPRLSTGGSQMCWGWAARPSLMSGTRRTRQYLERWGRSSVLRPLLRLPGRVIRSMERRERYG